MAEGRDAEFYCISREGVVSGTIPYRSVLKEGSYNLVSQLQFIQTPTSRDSSFKVRLIAIPGDKPFLKCRRHMWGNRAVTCTRHDENGRWVGECIFCEVYESLYKLYDKERDHKIQEEARPLKPMDRYFYLAVDRDHEENGVSIFSQGRMVSKIILDGVMGEPDAIREPVKRFHCACCKKHIMRWAKWPYRIKKWAKRKWNEFLISRGWRQPLDLTPFSITHGRDLVVHRRMKMMWPDYSGYFTGRSPLGTPEQITLWTKQAEGIDVQKLVDPPHDLEAIEHEIAERYGHLSQVHQYFQRKPKPAIIDEVW